MTRKAARLVFDFELTVSSIFGIIIIMLIVVVLPRHVLGLSDRLWGLPATRP